MAKQFGGMPMGGMNMGSLMKQAQKMQKQMEEVQAKLGDETLTVTSGGGAVELVITGKKELKSVTIDKDVIDPDDKEMLEDLILTAVNEAIRQSEELNAREMAKVTGVPGMPGLF